MIYLHVPKAIHGAVFDLKPEDVIVSDMLPSGLTEVAQHGRVRLTMPNPPHGDAVVGERFDVPNPAIAFAGALGYFWVRKPQNPSSLLVFVTPADVPFFDWGFGNEYPFYPYLDRWASTMPLTVSTPTGGTADRVQEFRTMEHCIRAAADQCGDD